MNPANSFVGYSDGDRMGRGLSGTATYTQLFYQNGYVQVFFD